MAAYADVSRKARRLIQECDDVHELLFGRTHRSDAWTLSVVRGLVASMTRSARRLEDAIHTDKTSLSDDEIQKLQQWLRTANPQERTAL